MAYIVYVLTNNRGVLYKGYTSNLEKRIAQHNEGKTISTRKKGPWFLVYSEESKTRQEAMKRERFLKSGKGREWLKINIIK